MTDRPEWLDRGNVVQELMRQMRRDNVRLQPPDVRAGSQPILGPGYEWTPERVADAVAARRAVHAFDGLTSTREQLTGTLREARLADWDLWPDEVAAGREVDLVVLAWRVEGLARGAYRVTPAVDLEPITPRSSTGRHPSAREFVIQNEFAAAPYHMLAGGSLAAALDAHGLHGHRLLATRAASALHTAWLATVAAGGHGCIFGGVVDSAVRQWAAADGHQRSLVVGAAFGYPSSPAPSPRS